MRRIAFLDPWSPALYQDALFRDGPLNRDNVQRPWIVLKEEFERRGVECHTADLLLTGRVCGDENIYVSIGQREYWPLLKTRPNVRLAAYFQLEPPVVDPAGYKMLPKMHKAFERVYTHEPSLFGGTKFYWPQVRDGVIPERFSPRKRLVMINSNKAPHVEFNGTGELYSERLRALKVLGDRIDLYGFGWERGANCPLPEGFVTNYGSVADKFATLKQYDFAMCLENQQLPGYVTEKIFECLFTGTVPIYLGAPDIADYVFPGCFIDLRNFDGYEELAAYLEHADPEVYRRNTVKYFASPEWEVFTSQYFAQSVVSTVLG